MSVQPGQGATEMWASVWSTVAAELSDHWRLGLQRLLTEDVLRFSTVRSLVMSGLAPDVIQTEWRATPGESVDLVVGLPVHAAVEFKFPREPKQTNAPWPQIHGSLLRDLFRLAVLPPSVTQRWCVQLLSTPLRRYLSRSERAVQVGLDTGETTLLTPDRVAALPAVARGKLGSYAEAMYGVRAVCASAHPIGTDLVLLTHVVEPVDPNALTA